MQLYSIKFKSAKVQGGRCLRQGRKEEEHQQKEGLWRPFCRREFKTQPKNQAITWPIFYCLACGLRCTTPHATRNTQHAARSTQQDRREVNLINRSDAQCKPFNERFKKHTYLRMNSVQDKRSPLFSLILLSFLVFSPFSSLLSSHTW